ncbi:MAG: zf-TFIIB domain-containing protein [Methanothrix sp.]
MVTSNICPKCGTNMHLVEDEGKPFYQCNACGYKTEILGLAEHECSKCGYGKSIMYYHGIVYGDEAPLVMYTCIKCGNVDREGVS